MQLYAMYVRLHEMYYAHMPFRLAKLKICFCLSVCDMYTCLQVFIMRNVELPRIESAMQVSSLVLRSKWTAVYLKSCRKSLRPMLMSITIRVYVRLKIYFLVSKHQCLCFVVQIYAALKTLHAPTETIWERKTPIVLTPLENC
jgi:hypothetical protein